MCSNVTTMLNLNHNAVTWSLVALGNSEQKIKRKTVINYTKKLQELQNRPTWKRKNTLPIYNSTKEKSFVHHSYSDNVSEICLYKINAISETEIEDVRDECMK